MEEFFLLIFISLPVLALNLTCFITLNLTTKHQPVLLIWVQFVEVHDLWSLPPTETSLFGILQSPLPNKSLTPLTVSSLSSWVSFRKMEGMKILFQLEKFLNYNSWISKCNILKEIFKDSISIADYLQNHENNNVTTGKHSIPKLTILTKNLIGDTISTQFPAILTDMYYHR